MKTRYKQSGKSPLELGLAVPALGPSKWAEWANRVSEETEDESGPVGEDPDQFRLQLWPVIEGLG
jgi:hypothetical protein